MAEPFRSVNENGLLADEVSSCRDSFCYCLFNYWSVLFLTGVSLRSLDVLMHPSICFGGNNYEIRFSFVVSKE